MRNKFGQYEKGNIPVCKGLPIGFKHSNKTKIKMSESAKGEKNSQWKGRKKTSNGYILILNPGHPFCTKRGYVNEHRLVLERHIGRYLTAEEEIHHRNGIRDDNRIENLELLKNKAEHSKISFNKFYEYTRRFKLKKENG